MNILGDFKSLLTKGSTLSIAVGVALGTGVYHFADHVIEAVVLPLLMLVTGGSNGLMAKGDFTYFKFATLLASIVAFAAFLAVLYAIFVIVLPLLGIGKCCDDKDQTPPPPAPPVV